VELLVSLLSGPRFSFPYKLICFQWLTCQSVSTTIAAISTQCPTKNVCFSLNIPDATASSGNGDIFMQITGPSSYRWLSLGQGSRMNNANYFIIYPSSSGNNITLSPRLARSHNTPTYNSATQATLLAGSGVLNGVMTANIKCISSRSN